MSNREVDWVFGLVVGMINAESRAVEYRSMGLKVSDRPALDWYSQFQDDPVIGKAREIYQRERKKAVKQMTPTCRRPR